MRDSPTPPVRPVGEANCRPERVVAQHQESRACCATDRTTPWFPRPERRPHPAPPGCWATDPSVEAGGPSRAHRHLDPLGFLVCTASGRLTNMARETIFGA